MAGRFNAWWADTPRPVRWTVYTAVPIGGGTLALGVVGDTRDWWKDHEFLTNLMSSFTGLLLGVPFALVVLSHLGAMQADAAVRRSAIRRGREAAIRFQETCLRGFTRSVAFHALNDLGNLRRADAILRTKLRELMTLLEPTPTTLGRVSPNMQTRIDVRTFGVLEAFEDRAEIIDEMFSAANSRQRNAWLAEVAQEWSRLDRDVRPRLEEVGGRWMMPETYEALRKSGKQLDNLSTPAMMPLRRTLQVFAVPEDGIPGPSPEVLLRAAEKIKEDSDATLEVIRALLAVLRALPEVEQVALP